MRPEVQRAVKDKVLRHKPFLAQVYFLKSATGRWPSEDGFSLEPFQLPLGVPKGSYRLGFLNSMIHGEQLAPLVTGTAPPTIEIYEDKPDDTSQALTKSERQDARVEADSIKRLLLEDPTHREDVVDYQRERMADQISENRQLLGKRITYTQELAETFVLHRAWRHDLESMQRIVSETHVKTLKAADELQDAALRSVAKAKKLSEESSSPASNLPAILSTVSEGFQFLGGLLGGRRRGKKGERPIDAVFGGDDEDEDGDTTAATLKKLAKENEELRKRLDEAEQKRAMANQSATTAPKVAPESPPSGSPGTPEPTTAVPVSAPQAPPTVELEPQVKQATEPSNKKPGTNAKSATTKPVARTGRKKPPKLLSGKSPTKTGKKK